MTAPTPRETMIVAAARALAGVEVCFVGIGLPNLACALAKRTVAPHLTLVYESGIVGADPARLPLSIGDPTLVSGALAVTGMWELFAHHLQRGLIDVAFLSGAQIDRSGNLNTTVIGDYAAPAVRLPGSGGACEIALNARRTFILMSQSRRTFVEQVDFVTSPGHPVPGRGGGPERVITQLGEYVFVDGQMTLARLHPGATLDQVRETLGWEPAIASSLGTTDPPGEHELAVLRDELDPNGIYSR